MVNGFYLDANDAYHSFNMDAVVAIRHGACRMQCDGANPDWIRPACIVPPGKRARHLPGPLSH